MAQYNITINRQKADLTTPLTEGICLIDTTGAEIANTEDVSTSEEAIGIAYESLPSDVYPLTAGAITADIPNDLASSTVTLTNVTAAAFTDLRVGDLIFGVNDVTTVWTGADDPTQDTGGDEDFTAGQGTSFATGAYVSAFDAGANTIDVTVSAGAVLLEANLSAAEIAWRRNGITVTIAQIGVRLAATGANLTITPVLYQFSGDASEGASQDDFDNRGTTDSASNTVLATTTINLDSFLAESRVARTND